MGAVRNEDVAEVLAKIANAFADAPLTPEVASLGLKVGFIITDFLEDRDKMAVLYDSKLDFIPRW